MWETDGYSRLETQWDMQRERANAMQREAASQKALKVAKDRLTQDSNVAEAESSTRGRLPQPVMRRVARFLAGLF